MASETRSNISRMLGWFRSRVAAFRNAELLANPPGIRANLLWIIASLAGAWLLGWILTPRCPWVWNWKITVRLNLPNWTNIPIPEFSGWLFAGSAFCAALLYLAPFYLLSSKGGWRRYIKEVCWRNVILLLGIPIFSWIGGMIGDLFSLIGMEKWMTYLNKMNAGIEVNFAYAPGKPMIITSSLGALLGLVFGAFLLSRRTGSSDS